MVAALAGVQLALGQSVVVDAVNPVKAARDIWVDLAERARVPLRVIEVVCGDEAEHRRRVEPATPSASTSGPPTGSRSWSARPSTSRTWAARLVVDTTRPGDPLDAILAYIRGAL